MHTVVLRVWLPDRPGALGQVASRIGAVRGDVLGIEILETGGGRVVDELVIALPDETVIDLLVREVSAVDGVSVEHVRRIEGDRLDPDLATLAVGVELAECEPSARLAVLCDGVARITDAEWAAVVRGQDVVEASGDPPDPVWLLAFLDGSRHLRDANGAPRDIVWARLAGAGAVVVAGRSARPVHVRERSRVDLLARLADALIRR